MERPETQYAMSGDVHVAFQVSGSGPIDFVWAPGTVSILEMDWDWPPKARFIRRLSRFCRLIRFDKRGTGLSDRVMGAPTLEERVDDIRAVMDAAGSERAFVFGVSEGASMAAMFAATYPDRTRGLLVWGGAARWIKTEDWPWGWTLEESEQDRKNILRSGITASDFSDEIEPETSPDEQERWLDFMVRYWRAGASPSAYEAFSRMNDNVDVRDILPSIRVPTLVMHAVNDGWAEFDAGRDLALRIPGARFLEFPGKHFFFNNDKTAEAVATQIEEFLTGARRVPSNDRALATVLFTDIVGSTERLVSVGDRAWRDLVASHHDIIRAELDVYRGREVDTAGDGFFATFDGPGRAVACARSVIDRLWPVGLDIRAGVHTGECEIINDKVGGIAVHVGARIAALAGPREVLVSSTVKDLTAGSGITFEDYGECALKGIPEHWHLYRVVAVGDRNQ